MITKNYPFDKNEFGMNYVVCHPEKYEDLPLIIYLHGAGERGVNVANVYRHGIPELVAEGCEIPAILLFPQCPAWAVWDNVADRLKAIIDRVVGEYSVRPDRISITGSSMGGYGTWTMGITYPSFFAGVAPIAGGGMSWRVSKLRNTPVLAMHGIADGVVPVTCSDLMVEALKRSGGNVTYIRHEGLDHNDGIDYSYKNTDLVEWLIKQRRTNFDYVPEICENMF